LEIESMKELAEVVTTALYRTTVNTETGDLTVNGEETVTDVIDFASVDVSFISLKIILPVMRQLLGDNAQAVCLIKPQFEAGKDKIGKKGVVRELSTHIDVVRMIFDFSLENGFDVLNLDFSPVKGPEGNIEYLIYLRKSEDATSYLEREIEEIVQTSHSTLA